MKPVKHTSHIWAVTALCALCFAAGAAVPLLMESRIPLDKAETVYGILENQWYFGQQEEDLSSRLEEQAIIGMTTLEEDPHTNYFDLEQAQAFTKSLQGSGVGLGITYYQDEAGHFVVREVFVGSTADKAGLQPADVILQVGTRSTQGAKAEDIIQTIQNHDGQRLDLLVERDGKEQTIIVEPGTFDSTVSMERQKDAGIIRLASFSEMTGQDFKEAVNRLQKQNVKNLIIDLRNNTGGYLSAAEEIANVLLPKGDIVYQEKDAKGNQTAAKAGGTDMPAAFENIILLQNANSASASEVLIGALSQNLDNVTTVGTTTYGKGTIQTSIPFSDGTSLKYTIAEWLLPDGTSINAKGIAPDKEVEDDGIGTVTLYAMEEEDTIEPDTVHDNAGAVQSLLAYLGYETDRTDNYFSQASSQALMAFQEAAGLEPTGIVDQTTWNQLTEQARMKMYANERDDDVQMQAALALLEGK